MIHFLDLLFRFLAEAAIKLSDQFSTVNPKKEKRLEI